MHSVRALGVFTRSHRLVYSRFSIADFLNSVRISDCNRPNRYFYQSMNFPASAKRRMNFLNRAPHLLADETIVGMTLSHGAKLDHVQRFAQVHLHVPADLVRERDDVRASADLAMRFTLMLRASFSTCARSYSICMPSHTSRLDPNALESRTAISAEMPPLPFTKLFQVLGASHRGVSIRLPSIPTARYTLGGQCVQDEAGSSCAYLKSLGVVSPIHLLNVRASSLVVACRGPQRESPRHYRELIND